MAAARKSRKGKKAKKGRKAAYKKAAKKSRKYAAKRKAAKARRPAKKVRVRSRRRDRSRRVRCRRPRAPLRPLRDRLRARELLPGRRVPPRCRGATVPSPRHRGRPAKAVMARARTTRASKARTAGKAAAKARPSRARRGRAAEPAGARKPVGARVPAAAPSVKFGRQAPGVAVTGAPGPRYGEILTPAALAFLAGLHRAFDATRKRLLAARTARQQRFDAGDRAVPPALAVARVRSVPDDSRLQADRLIPVARMERGGIREHQSGIALRSMRATSTSSDGDHCCAEPPS